MAEHHGAADGPDDGAAEIFGSELGSPDGIADGFDDGAAELPGAELSAPDGIAEPRKTASGPDNGAADRTTGGPKGSDDGAPAPAVSEDTWAPKLARLRDGVAEGAADGEATPAVRVAVGPGDGKPALLSSRLGSLDGAAVREGFVDGSDEETILPRRGRRWTDEPVPVVAGRVVPEFGTAVDDEDAGRRRMPCRFDRARARGQSRRSTPVIVASRPADGTEKSWGLGVRW